VLSRSGFARQAESVASGESSSGQTHRPRVGHTLSTGGALDDVREGPDGTLYFTHLGKPHIGYIRPDGTFGKIQAKVWNNSICVTRDGKWLYYGLCIGDDQLRRQVVAGKKCGGWRNWMRSTSGAGGHLGGLRKAAE